MNFKKYILLIPLTLLPPLVLLSEEEPLFGGTVAIISADIILTNTEVARRNFEELSASEGWKEVEEDRKLKLSEAKEIEDKIKKEGPTMSEQEKVDNQKRYASLTQDINFLTQKMQTMSEDVRRLVIQEQSETFQKIVTEIIRAKGIKILLNENAVLYFDRSDPVLNITPEIIDLLNENQKEK